MEETNYMQTDKHWSKCAHCDPQFAPIPEDMICPCKCHLKEPLCACEGKLTHPEAIHSKKKCAVFPIQEPEQTESVKGLLNLINDKELVLKAAKQGAEDQKNILRSVKEQEQETMEERFKSKFVTEMPDGTKIVAFYDKIDGIDFWQDYVLLKFITEEKRKSFEEGFNSGYESGK